MRTLKLGWLIPALLLALDAGAAGPKTDPVIVEDRAEIDRALREAGVPFEAIYVPSLAEARRARGDLARFLRAEIKRADRARAGELRKLLRASPSHRWHCGGFERGGGRYLHCTFAPATGEATPRFSPLTEAATCRCSFDPRNGPTGKIIAVRCSFDP